ncbi:hypothetical protein [Pseudomonas sp.]|uniref:hypothetical protein n=1 Tax=Pseudomonas sp. TaxID=306 RepID=UPI003C758010
MSSLLNNNAKEYEYSDSLPQLLSAIMVSQSGILISMTDDVRLSLHIGLECKALGIPFFSSASEYRSSDLIKGDFAHYVLSRKICKSNAVDFFNVIFGCATHVIRSADYKELELNYMEPDCAS